MHVLVYACMCDHVCMRIVRVPDCACMLLRASVHACVHARVRARVGMYIARACVRASAYACVCIDGFWDDRGRISLGCRHNREGGRLVRGRKKKETDKATTRR